MKTPSDENIAIEIIIRFLGNPHAKQRANYEREKKAFAEGAVWMRTKIKELNT